MSEKTSRENMETFVSQVFEQLDIHWANELYLMDGHQTAQQNGSKTKKKWFWVTELNFAK